MTPTAEESARTELADYSARIHSRGWVANHDGNISMRLGGGFLATPTAVSKADVTPASILALDDTGKVIENRLSPGRKVFSEIALHLAAYRCRPDAQVVLHAHPPHATALAVSQTSFWDQPFMAEGVVSLGESIPLVAFFPPGEPPDPLSFALTSNGSSVDAVLLANHGVLTLGPDLETAFLRMELVEHLARIYLLSLPAGGPRPLMAQDIARLLQARIKAGLGPKSVEDIEQANAAQNRAHHGPTDISALVQDALKRFR